MKLIGEEKGPKLKRNKNKLEKRKLMNLHESAEKRLQQVDERLRKWKKKSYGNVHCRYALVWPCGFLSLRRECGVELCLYLKISKFKHFVFFIILKKKKIK